MAPLSGQGVLWSVLASCLFALIPAYVFWLAPLDGQAILAWRVVGTLPAVLLLVVWCQRVAELLGELRRVLREPWRLLLIALATALMAVQWWLFLWAPLQGQTLEMSLGYFLLPLTMVLAGRVFYGERLRPLQRIAVWVALVGVVHELWLTQAFSWVTLLVALGYPPYFMLRRHLQLQPLVGLTLEMLLLIPLALAYLLWLPDMAQVLLSKPALWLLLPGLGVLSAAAFVLYLSASRLLPFGLFGILSYVEPVLLFLLAWLWLGESLSWQSLLTYGPIWLAVLISVADSLFVLRRQRQINPAAPV
ncbi:chloramphenicol-sensitive protein RarD [Atopomonas hussainii]|uniref:Chloramphenicol-sensitive protein RarD n=1 Tax=Atopomonas hussainii TaxID=1429083 RepID=A0A1H7L1Z5_9GAMM|nr:EamA family transporter RarD [Atopomonas hussainii]SEK92810.1 chloramphenicol-sensitive protein RarD [Atopomonas hussainii]